MRIMAVAGIEPEFIRAHFAKYPDSGLQLEFSDELVSYDDCCAALRSGMTAGIVLPISLIPPGGAPDLAIAALLPRQRPAINIYYNDTDDPANHLVRLRRGALIGCDDATILAQLQQILPEFNYSLIDERHVISPDEYDGVILLHRDVPASVETDASFAFNPRELVPPAGMYIYALMCLKENEDARQVLAALNDTDVSRLSNIERRVLKSLTAREYSGIHVYCEADTLQNYHLYVACLDESGKLQSARYSSGLSSGMEDEIIELLMPPNKLA